MGKEVEEDEATGEEEGEGSGGTSGDCDRGAATNEDDRGRSSRSDGRRPRMDKLCTLLLPPLRQGRDGIGGARVIWTFIVGEHPGHQTFSRGPWPEYRHARLGRRHVFRQSTKDSIVSVVMQIEGYLRWLRTFEFVVRCDTLLAYAAAAARDPSVMVVDDPTAGGAAGSSNGERKTQAQARVVVGDGDVPWAAWGPRATALSDQTHVGWRYLLGERRATIAPTNEAGVHRIRIRDYNPYRIRQAKASMVAKGLGRHEWGGGGDDDSHEHEGEGYPADEGEGIVDPFHAQGTRRITERSVTRAGEWFEEDVRTALPHLSVVVDVPGCREIYMEQDQVLLRVDDLDKVSPSSPRFDRLMMLARIGADSRLFVR